MTTPVRWCCYGCGGPVPMCEDGPLKWFELTDYKPGEMQAVAAICDQFPKCGGQNVSCEVLEKQASPEIGGSSEAHGVGEENPKCKRHSPCEIMPDGYCARCHSEMYP